MTQAVAAPAAITSREISTLDLLKTLAVVLMIVDHVGLYFVLDDQWYRILGRPVSVVFGFLIGFARTTRVPASWVFLGLGLTLLSGWLFPENDDNALDILIALALARIVTPFFVRVHDAHPLWLVALAILLGLLTEPVNEHLEYGTEVMIMALLGVAVRLDNGTAPHRTGRDAVALVAMVAMSYISIGHFGLEGWPAGACIGLLAATILWLSRFTLRPVAMPGFLAPVLRLCGRHTLWIYAVHLAAFQIAAWWIANMD